MSQVVQSEVVGETTDVAPIQTPKSERVLSIIIGFVASILAIRFVLTLLGANRSNGFADLIYSVTYPLVSPFFGLFGYKFEYGVARVEVETLAAIAVYALIGYGIGRLLALRRPESA
jgi:uncharacterized protein YggT (Ycf19 family)